MRCMWRYDDVINCFRRYWLLYWCLDIIQVNVFGIFYIHHNRCNVQYPPNVYRSTGSPVVSVIGLTFWFSNSIHQYERHRLIGIWISNINLRWHRLFLAFSKMVFVMFVTVDEPPTISKYCWVWSEVKLEVYRFDVIANNILFVILKVCVQIGITCTM